MQPKLLDGAKLRRAAARRSLWFWAAVFIGGLVVTAAAVMSIRRLLSCSNTNFDLAFYVRIVWGLAYGDRFNPLIGAHDLGLHLSPVLYIFVPFALFLPISKMLLTVQALVLGCCVPLVYTIALRKTGKVMIGLAFALAWALFPAILQIGSREFHPGTLALLPLLAAYDAMDRKRFFTATLLLFFAVLCREDVALVASAAGALMFFTGKGRSRLPGILVAAGGLLYFLVYVVAVQPLFLPPTGSIDEHFSQLGHSAPEVLRHIITHPADVVPHFLSVDKLIYVAGLILPLCFLPLLSPKWLIPAAAPLFFNLLSSFPDATRVESHYATLLIPSLFFAALGGMEKISGVADRKFKVNKKAASAVFASLALIIFIMSLLAQYLSGALPGARKYEKGAYSWGKNNGTLCWYAGDLAKEKDLSVLAPYGALALLADRRRVYSIDFIHPKPDAAIIEVDQKKWVRLSVERWFEPWQAEYEKLIRDYRYGKPMSNPPYELFWKGKPGGPERVQAVSLEQLPEKVRLQSARWKGHVKLEAIEGRLRIETEKWSGEYEKGIVVQIVFYWKALTKLPADLFIKCTLSGGGNTHIRYFRPTSGIRKTGTWRKDEIIRDEQVFVSPGGWPLKEIKANVVFITPDKKPYPDGAEPRQLVWPEWEAERDK